MSRVAAGSFAHADSQRDRGGDRGSEARAGRPLEELYPIMYLDALMVKVRNEGHIQNKAIYVVLGVNLEGQRTGIGGCVHIQKRVSDRLVGDRRTLAGSAFSIYTLRWSKDWRAAKTHRIRI